MENVVASSRKMRTPSQKTLHKRLAKALVKANKLKKRAEVKAAKAFKKLAKTLVKAKRQQIRDAKKEARENKKK
jgi:hypothetical protein